MKTNNYPEYIMMKLRQRQDLEEDDTSMDDELNALSPSEVFSEVCQWEGLLGFSETIKGWIEDVYGFDIDEIKRQYFQHR